MWVAALIASWSSGTLSAIWGPRRVMWLGAAIWIVFELPFLFVAVPAQNAPLIITVYAVRGLAYPLFAFAFLVWIQVVAPARLRGSAAGFFGDHFGWRRTVTVFGCLGCAVATPLWYSGAIASQSFLLTAVLGAVYGIVLAGFVPLSALMPSMVAPKDKGAALAVLNTGAAGAALLGPLTVTALYPLTGGSGVAIASCLMYLVVAGVSLVIRSDVDPGSRPAADAASARTA